MTDQSRKPRARELGIPFPGQTGLNNSITDVAGIRVGFSTLTDPSRQIRTGVTVIKPRQDQGLPRPVWAGQYTLNGNGEMTGTHWINDAGYFIGPVCITNTHSVGMVHHAVTRWMINHYDDYFRDHHAWAMPVVAETYDGVLNDINGQHVTADVVFKALNNTSEGSCPEGSVGGGNGMICYEFKGGTGTASRITNLAGTDYTIGALVQANHGIRPWLNILGQPVGRLMPDHRLKERESGSIIVLLATDAPLSSLSLRHIAKRAAIGIGRGGSPGGNSSGDIFLAFSVANDRPMPDIDTGLIQRDELNPELLDPVYLAAVESVEEAVVNALVAGVDVETVKPPGMICKAIDTEKLMELFALKK